MKHKHFWLASDDEDFRRLGLKRDTIAPWEDGQRISTDKNNLEWWYFDAHLDDGTAMVVQFYARPPFNPHGKFRPSVTVQLDFPDGRNVTRKFEGSAEDFQAATDACDVRIGRNRFVGDLKEYRIHVEIEDVVVDVLLRSTVPPFRMATSHSYFGDEENASLFAWLPSVPQGEVETTIRIGSEVQERCGIGYHDHNWGDAPMWKVMHRWYWTRAKIGPWTAIAAFIVGAEEYGYGEQVNFMLAKDGRIVACDFEHARFSATDIQTNETTGKPVANTIAFDHDQGEDSYRVEFVCDQTIVETKFADQLPKLIAPLAKFAGFNGAYHRFTGKVRLEHRHAGELVEQAEDHALWELMYFGDPLPETGQA